MHTCILYTAEQMHTVWMQSPASRQFCRVITWQSLTQLQSTIWQTDNVTHWRAQEETARDQCGGTMAQIISDRRLILHETISEWYDFGYEEVGIDENIAYIGCNIMKLSLIFTMSVGEKGMCASILEGMTMHQYMVPYVYVGRFSIRNKLQV